MKLRIRDNSIRLRLTKTDVAIAASEGVVRAYTQFADGHTFAYVLEGSPTAIRPEANIAGAVLTVSIPLARLRQWTESEQVSISSQQDLNEGDKLNILIEKDFACLAPRDGEDESDMFQHPGDGS